MHCSEEFLIVIIRGPVPDTVLILKSMIDKNTTKYSLAIKIFFTNCTSDIYSSIHTTSTMIATVLLLSNIIASFAANVEFCQSGGDCTGDYAEGPILTDLGFSLNINSKIMGLGNPTEVKFQSAAFGILEERCYNNGKWDSPGQNKDAPTSTGSVTGDLSAVNTG